MGTPVFHLVLEVDDDCLPAPDPVFEVQSGASCVGMCQGNAHIHTLHGHTATTNGPMADGDGAAAAKLVREKQRGRRSLMDTMNISKLDREPWEVDGSRTVQYFSGNPTIESTKGVLHLYLDGTYTEHDTKALPALRSRTICILGVPNAIEVPDLLSFLAPVQAGLLHVRIIRYVFSMRVEHDPGCNAAVGPAARRPTSTWCCCASARRTRPTSSIPASTAARSVPWRYV